MARVNVRALLFAAIVCAFAAGCGGGAGSLMPHSIGGNVSGGNSSHATAILRILIPAAQSSPLGSLRRTPKYISPSTAQLAYSIDGASQTPVTLTTANPDCSGSPVQCNVPFNVVPGAHTFQFVLEDAHGAALSGVTSVSSTLTAGAANTLSVTLGGIATQVLVQPTSDANRMQGSLANGFQIYGNAAVSFAIVLLDADGNAIVGSGAPAPSISPSAGAPFTIASPAAGSNVWTLTSSYNPTNPTVPSITGFTIISTPVPNNGIPTPVPTPTPSGTATAAPNPQVLTAAVTLGLYQPWIFVVNSGSNVVTAYDEQGNQKVVSFASVNAPRGIALQNSTVTPAPSTSPTPYVGDMYVTNSGNNSVGVYAPIVPIATATTVPGSFSGLSGPGPIAFDGSNNQFYVANTTGSNALSAFDYLGNAAVGFTAPAFVATPTPVPTATAAPGWVQTAIAADATDHLIFVASYLSGSTNKVTTYSETGATNTSWTTGLNQPSGLAYDPNSGWIYVANKGSNNVTTYNSSGVQQSVTVTGLSSPGALLFDPYANVFYVVDGGNTMKAFSESGSAVTVSGFSALSGATQMVLLP